MTAQLEYLCENPASVIEKTIEGMNAARLAIINHRAALAQNGMWNRFDAIWNQYTEELRAIDARIEKLTVSMLVVRESLPIAAS